MKLQLNGLNCITAINERVVSFVRYSVGILKWTKDKLQNMDRKTRKLLNIYLLSISHSGDVNGLYSECSKDGRGANKCGRL